VSIGTRTDLFLKAKQALRLHRDWTDEQVAEWLGLKGPELELVTEARKDLEAG
jgi:hypothetical protein